MSSDDAALVQESFAKVQASGEPVPELFHARPFQIAAGRRAGARAA